MPTCVNCKTTFTQGDPAKVTCSDDGIFLFCDKDCKDKFVYSNGLEDGFKKWRQLQLEDWFIF
jgi:hypothetical protein